MLKIKEQNGTHNIRLDFRMPGIVFLVAGILAILFGPIMTLIRFIESLRVPNSTFNLSINGLSLLAPILGALMISLGVFLLVLKDEMIVDTVNRFLVYKKQKIPFSDIICFEYNNESVKFAPVGTPQSQKISLALVKKDDRIELFPNLMTAIIYIPKTRTIDKKKEVFDYLVKITGIEGTTITNIIPLTSPDSS